MSTRRPSPCCRRRRWRQLRRRLAGDQGAGAAEVVIAVPLLMLLILAITQFAIWAHASAVAQAAAEEALAAARVQGSGPAAGLERAQQVLGQIGGAALVSPQVSVTRTAGSFTVQITATAEQVIPLFRPPVHVTVTGPAERFVPDRPAVTAGTASRSGGTSG